MYPVAPAMNTARALPVFIPPSLFPAAEYGAALQVYWVEPAVAARGLPRTSTCNKALLRYGYLFKVLNLKALRKFVL